MTSNIQVNNFNNNKNNNKNDVIIILYIKIRYQKNVNGLSNLANKGWKKQPKISQNS